MDLIVWSQAYAVGHEMIDSQHKELVGLINELHKISLENSNVEHLEKVLKDVADYTVYHFECEESLMRKTSCPDYLSHKQKHDNFIKMVTEIKQEFIDGDSTVKEKLMLFLVGWLKEHILGADKNLSEYTRIRKAS